MTDMMDDSYRMAENGKTRENCAMLLCPAVY